jgi:hypothetical protein
VLALLFQGHVHVLFPGNEQISVEADAIDCSAGEVDITAHLCKVSFGAKTATLTGRKAHELYATMLEAGVPPDGSAGVVHETLSHLMCRINPQTFSRRLSPRQPRAWEAALRHQATIRARGGL